MLCVPAASADVEKVETPAPFNAPVPSVVEPSLNVTVPAGIPPPPEGVTVAVKVTDVPTAIDGLGVLVRAVAGDVKTPGAVTVTDSTPLTPGVALFTLMVTPVDASAYADAVASSA